MLPESDTLNILSVLFFIVLSKYIFKFIQLYKIILYNYDNEKIFTKVREHYFVNNIFSICYDKTIYRHIIIYILSCHEFEESHGEFIFDCD